MCATDVNSQDTNSLDDEFAILDQHVALMKSAITRLNQKLQPFGYRLKLEAIQTNQELGGL